MALDGIIIHNINHILQDRFPARINRIAQISNHEIVFTCFKNQKFNLLISTDSISNRILETSEPIKRSDTPNHFIMLLRKHCENGIIQSSEQIGLDRIIKWTITNRNDLGDIVEVTLMIELMGKYANIVLVDETGRIIDAFHRIPPYENTKRIIFSGAMYTLPEQQDRQNPFTSQTFNPELDIIKQFHGISPLLGREVDYRIKHGESFSDIFKQLHHHDQLYVSGDKFHQLPLKHLNQSVKTYDLMAGLEVVYQQQVDESRLKQHTGDLLKRVRRELKRQNNKLPKLKKQLFEARDYEKYQTIGDILLTYGHDIKAGQSEVTLNDFEDNPITIELDARYDGMRNAQKYFQRYHKLKTSQFYINEQIKLTQQEIEYLEGVLIQIEQGSIDDAIEIKQELMNHGLIRSKQKSHRKSQKKSSTPKIKHYEIDGVTISYGLNNIQNEYLTFKKAQKNHLWLHVQDGAGSHVVCDASELTERQLRFAANLAAYYSKYRLSSSVAVNYTLVKNLKKIPKAPLGMVSLGTHQTIYIDPQEPEKQLLEGIN